MKPEKPLFIPLKREHFEAFAAGRKAFEYRELGPRWNERTCRVGRLVVLSCGYGKARRLRGTISHFSTSNTPSLLPGWASCYGDNHRPAAIIGITLSASKWCACGTLSEPSTYQGVLVCGACWKPVKSRRPNDRTLATQPAPKDFNSK